MGEQFTPRSLEIEEHHPGVFERDGQWYASADGKHSVSIPADLGRNISVALRAQKKIEAVLAGVGREGFRHMIKMLNCRKVALAVAGRIPLKRVVSGSRLLTPEGGQSAIDTASGLAELTEDVDRLLRAGNIPVLGTRRDMHIAQYIEEHAGEMPVIVHVFNVQKSDGGTLLAKLMRPYPDMRGKDFIHNMNRDHTFLVLGKDSAGKYVCFQKRGPALDHPFEMTSLEKVMELAVAPDPDRIYVSVIGSTDSPSSDKSSNRSIANHLQIL